MFHVPIQFSKTSAEAMAEREKEQLTKDKKTEEAGTELCQAQCTLLEN